MMWSFVKTSERSEQHFRERSERSQLDLKHRMTLNRQLIVIWRQKKWRLERSKRQDQSEASSIWNMRWRPNDNFSSSSYDVNTHTVQISSLFFLKALCLAIRQRHSFRQNLPQMSDDESFFSEDGNCGLSQASHYQQGRNLARENRTQHPRYACRVCRFAENSRRDTELGGRSATAEWTTARI